MNGGDECAGAGTATVVSTDPLDMGFGAWGAPLV